MRRPPPPRIDRAARPYRASPVVVGAVARPRPSRRRSSADPPRDLGRRRRRRLLLELARWSARSAPATGWARGRPWRPTRRRRCARTSCTRAPPRSGSGPRRAGGAPRRPRRASAPSAIGMSPSPSPRTSTVGHCRPLARWNVVSTTRSRVGPAPRRVPVSSPCPRRRRAAGAGSPAQVARRARGPAPATMARHPGRVHGGLHLGQLRVGAGQHGDARPSPSRGARHLGPVGRPGRLVVVGGVRHDPGHRPVDPRRARRHHLAARRDAAVPQHGGGHRHDLGRAAVVLVEPDDRGAAQDARADGRAASGRRR